MKNEDISDKKSYFNKVLFSFIFWICSLFGFYGLIFAANGNFATAPTIFVILLLLDILFGIFCYVALLVYSLKGNKGGLLGLSFIIIIFFFIYLFKLPNSETNTNVSSNTQIASDQFVACPIHANCGGGTKQLKQNECMNSTCCAVGKVWVVLDKDECKLKQQDYANSQTRQAPQIIQVPQAPVIQMPQYKAPEPPLCCKERCSSFTNTCTTTCTKQWICF